MFTRFSQNKINYEKGQVFPFVIAIICVIIILIMITVNLGQIGIIKTDVSNAADAGALAAASVLSQTLLDFGLKSDSMCGLFYVELIIIVLAVFSIIGIPIAIATAIIFLVSQLLDFMIAYQNGSMGWANAKKTALQYAFNNVGVDEPRPTFEQFLDAIGAGSPANPGPLYEEYLKAETDRARTHARSGFSKFMEDGQDGYWHFGDIKPGKYSPAVVTSRYGWEQAPDTTFYNTYSRPNPTKGTVYNLYDNYVEVQTIGTITYPLKLYNPIDALLDNVNAWIDGQIGSIGLPSWLEWLLDTFVDILLALVTPLIAFLPAGLTFGTPSETAGATNNNCITVTVKRHKREQDLGLWRFRYGDVIAANAKSHAFRQNGDETIEPVSDLISALGEIGEAAYNLLVNGDWDWNWFETERHLFETELVETW